MTAPAAIPKPAVAELTSYYIAYVIRGPDAFEQRWGLTSAEPCAANFCRGTAAFAIGTAVTAGPALAISRYNGS
jgi:hypothetical protein